MEAANGAGLYIEGRLLTTTLARLVWECGQSVVSLLEMAGRKKEDWVKTFVTGSVNTTATYFGGRTTVHLPVLTILS
jgi:hypothetical protein